VGKGGESPKKQPEKPKKTDKKSKRFVIWKIISNFAAVL